MADQNINFTVTTNTANAEQGFNKVTETANKTQTSFNGMKGSSGSLNSTMIGLNYTIRDMPFGFIGIQNNLPMLFDGFQRLKAEAGGLGGAFGLLTKSLMSPLGVGIAFSAVTSLITYFTMHTGKAKDEAEKFDGSLNKLLIDVDKTTENLIKYKKELENISILDIDVKTNQISAEMAFLQKQIAENNVKLETYRQTWYNAMLLPVAGQLAQIGLGLGRMFYDWDNKENQKKLDLLVEGLAAISAKSQNVKGVFESFQKGTLGGGLSGMTFGELDQLKKSLSDMKKGLKPEGKGSINFGESWGWGSAKEIDALIARIDKLTSKTKELKETKEKIDKPMQIETETVDQWAFRRFGIIPKIKGISGVEQKGTDPMDAVTFMPEREKKLYEDLFQDAASVMSSEFNKAWDSIFGEANSLFEKMLANWSDTLFQYGMNQFAGSLLNMVFPGAGTVVDQLLGNTPASGGANRSGGSTNYLVVDGAVIGKFVEDYLPTAIANNKRLRKM